MAIQPVSLIRFTAPSVIFQEADKLEDNSNKQSVIRIDSYFINKARQPHRQRSGCNSQKQHKTHNEGSTPILSHKYFGSSQ